MSYTDSWANIDTDLRDAGQRELADRIKRMRDTLMDDSAKVAANIAQRAAAIINYQDRRGTPKGRPVRMREQGDA